MIPPKKAIIVGASSTIAICLAESLVQKGWNVVVETRDPKKGEDIKNHLTTLGGYVTHATGTPQTIWENEWKKKPCDLLIIATGWLPTHPKTCNEKEILETLEANCLIPMVWAQLAATSFETIKKGKIAIFGSVAGDRGRASNYIYGATKAAMETFCEGLAHRLQSNVPVILIKPGPTNTGMTATMPHTPLFAKPKVVAAQALQAIENSQAVVYTPHFWWGIMKVIRLLPTKIFWKTKM